MKIFSVGHSNLEWSTFENLLSRADVGVIADVRSNPVSRLSHFNRGTLRERLNKNGVAYLFLGVELGGRSRGGRVPDYERMAASPLFDQGIELVEQTASRTRLALMCSEHEPLACHRCLLVGRRLVERGAELMHILRDGTIEPHAATEDRLLVMTRQTERDLLASREERLAIAYRAQALRITRGTR